MRPARAVTLYMNGTEFCSVAHDSAKLLEKRGSGGHLSYISQDCRTKPGELPRNGMEDELAGYAFHCKEYVGEDRWKEFQKRWVQSGKTLASAESSHLVGAFCEALFLASAEETITFVNFAHGEAPNEGKLLEKTGTFSYSNGSPYNDSALWALLALTSSKQRVVMVHENCFGEAMMGGMLFGPKRDFSAYRPGSCAIAAAPHDKLLTMTLPTLRSYAYFKEENVCSPDRSKSTAPYGSFARNLEDLPKNPPPTIESYEESVARKGSVFIGGRKALESSNEPVSSSSSLLGLYYERYESTSSHQVVNLGGCAFQSGANIPFLASEGLKVAFYIQSKRLKTRLSKLYAEAVGRAIPKLLDIATLEDKLFDIEDEPSGPLSKAYAQANALRAEQDERRKDFDLLCSESIRPPACVSSTKTCLASDLKTSCARSVGSLSTKIYKQICEGVSRTKDKVSVADLLPRDDLKQRADAAEKRYGQIEKKAASLRYLVRLAKEARALDMMVADVESKNTKLAAEAQAAVRAYIGMSECEQKGIFE